MKKILSIVGGVILVALILGVVCGTIFIGPIIKNGVEQMGPKILQVPVKVDAVMVSALNGSAQIKGLVVNNPAGFKSAEAIKLGNASMKLDPMSVFKPKIVIHAVKIESPEITFEGGLGGNNLNKLVKNITAVLPSGGGPAPKIQLDDFLLTGARVHVSVDGGIASKEADLVLPDIHLTGLGQGTDGITPSELVSTVLGQVTAKTVEAVTRTVTASGITDSIGKDAGKQVGEGINKALGGIFGK